MTLQLLIYRCRLQCCSSVLLSLITHLQTLFLTTKYDKFYLHLCLDVFEMILKFVLAMCIIVRVICSRKIVTKRLFWERLLWVQMAGLFVSQSESWVAWKNLNTCLMTTSVPGYFEEKVPWLFVVTWFADNVFTHGRCVSVIDSLKYHLSNPSLITNYVAAQNLGNHVTTNNQGTFSSKYPGTEVGLMTAGCTCPY